jgi:5,10-methenyltetrahydrofolate synthetase
MRSEEDIREAKRALRKRIRLLREADPHPDSAPAVSAILSLDEWKAASTVLLYCALPGEVDLSPLFSEDKRIALPLVQGDTLVLKEYSPSALVPGFMGIMEPGPECREVLPSEIDFAVVPGVAFDRSCLRLGRGKGYYDRLLPSLSCPLAGVAFRWQIVDSVPCDRWDVPLDLVVADSEIFR